MYIYRDTDTRVTENRAEMARTFYSVYKPLEYYFYTDEGERSTYILYIPYIYSLESWPLATPLSITMSLTVTT